MPAIDRLSMERIADRKIEEANRLLDEADHYLVIADKVDSLQGLPVSKAGEMLLQMTYVDHDDILDALPIKPDYSRIRGGHKGFVRQFNQGKFLAGILIKGRERTGQDTLELLVKSGLAEPPEAKGVLHSMVRDWSSAGDSLEPVNGYRGDGVWKSGEGPRTKYHFVNYDK